MLLSQRVANSMMVIDRTGRIKTFFDGVQHYSSLGVRRRLMGATALKRQLFHRGLLRINHLRAFAVELAMPRTLMLPGGC